jgi:lipopolysaccharide heptosyltransferase III
MAIRLSRNGLTGGCVITEEKWKTGTSPSFLIVSLRYIGDVLLSTPLALSIKEQMPDAQVDYLVFAGTEGVLRKNPHVRTVHTIPPGSKSLGPLLSLWKKYDYAIGTSASDRTIFFSAAAGRRSLGFSYFQRKEWWKRLLLKDCRPYDDSLHIVPLILSQLEALRIPPHPRVVMGYDWADEDFVKKRLGDGDYILLHPYARREYKYWSPEGWGALAALIQERTGCRAVFTVSPNQADKEELKKILAHAPPGSAAFPEAFDLCQLAAAIKGSKGYVGVDTVVTHMAAALDVPTVALFGPTMVRHWGTWPNDCPEPAPYGARGGVQRFGHVAVIQKDWPCVPCNRETCAISDRGRIECMEALTAEDVFRDLLVVMGMPADS